MPLRDHFRPPISARHSWEGFHGGWPMVIVQKLFPILPDGYTAEPRVHLGKYYEIDVGGFEADYQGAGRESGQAVGVATLPWAPPQPTWTSDVDIGDRYEYEVLVYDRDRTLVAAVELVSPANKDRAEHRQAFVAKCCALLQKRVCVAIVDLVTIRQANLYAELLELLGRRDPSWTARTPATYAIACRPRTVGRLPLLESWAYPMELGQPLPTLPLWLDDDLAVALDLEASYEETCRVLRIA